MKKILGSLFLIVVLVAPALANDAGVSTTKPLSIIEFSRLPENGGLVNRMLERKYEEYRHGRVPRTTLDVSNIR